MPYSRCVQWRVFAKRVAEHILLYTIPQYGDFPEDEIESWTADQCIKSIQKYTRRFDSNMRGSVEQKRDMLKIAHFACLAYDKLSGNIEPLQSNAPPKIGGDYGYLE